MLWKKHYAQSPRIIEILEQCPHCLSTGIADRQCLAMANIFDSHAKANEVDGFWSNEKERLELWRASISLLAKAFQTYASQEGTADP